MKFIAMIVLMFTFVIPTEYKTLFTNESLSITSNLSDELTLIRPGREYVNKFMAYQEDNIDSLMNLLESAMSEGIEPGRGHNLYISPPGNYFVYWGYGQRQGITILFINRGDFPITNISVNIEIVVDIATDYMLGDFFIYLPRETWGIIHPNTVKPVFLELSQYQIDSLTSRLQNDIFLSDMAIILGELGL